MDLCLRPTFLQMVNGFALRWAMRRRIRPHSGRLVETDQTRMLCWLIGSTAQPLAVGVGHPTADTTFFRRLRVQTWALPIRSEEHTPELHPHFTIVSLLLLEKTHIGSSE